MFKGITLDWIFWLWSLIGREIIRNIDSPAAQSTHQKQCCYSWVLASVLEQIAKEQKNWGIYSRSVKRFGRDNLHINTTYNELWLCYIDLSTSNGYKKSTLVLLASSHLELISVHIYITSGSTCVTLSICAAAQTRALLSPWHRSWERCETSENGD